MEKYVYMIDYEDNCGSDQCECYDIKDLMTQLKYLKEDAEKIVNVKLVEVENRWHEEDISWSLGQRIKKFLGYKPEYMCCRNKKEKN